MSNRCRRLPTPSRRERKRPQRIASPASEPVLRPTPTPVNVSLGAIAHSTTTPTVLPTHLFSVAWLPRILGPRRSRDLADKALWALSQPLSGWALPDRSASPCTFRRPQHCVLRTPTN